MEFGAIGTGNLAGIIIAKTTCVCQNGENPMMYKITFLQTNIVPIGQPEQNNLKCTMKFSKLLVFDKCLHGINFNKLVYHKTYITCCSNLKPFSFNGLLRLQQTHQLKHPVWSMCLLTIRYTFIKDGMGVKATLTIRNSLILDKGFL